MNRLRLDAMMFHGAQVIRWLYDSRAWHWIRLVFVLATLFAASQYLSFRRFDCLHAIKRIYASRLVPELSRIYEERSLWTVRSMHQAADGSISRNDKHASGIMFCAFYAGSVGLSLLSVLAILFSCSTRIRACGYVTIFFAVWGDLTSRAIFGHSVTFSEVEISLGHMIFANTAMKTYSSTILTQMVKASVVIGGVAVLGLVSRLEIPKKWLFLVPMALGSTLTLTWASQAAPYLSHPAATRIPSLMVYWMIAGHYRGPRDPVDMKVVTDSKSPRVIIVIVDESVRGDHLEINGYHRKTTPYLSCCPGIVNYGVASSGGNRSESSNLILRSGLNQSQLPDYDQASLHMPSLFQYAKNAGYSTHYLDGQGSPGAYIDHMNEFEAQDIDEWWQASAERPSPKTHERDFLIGQRIIEIANSGRRSFIYVNKWGCHFHYEDCYPNEESAFLPTMKDDESIEEVQRQRLVNSYDNAIRWSVDMFMASLIPSLPYDETLMVYTSDHGQSLKEGGSLATHSVVDDAPSCQANVPLLVWGEHGGSSTATSLGSHSHFEIFPTLLCKMGYSSILVKQRYGMSLDDHGPRIRRFISGDIFGQGTSLLNEFRSTQEYPR